MSIEEKLDRLYQEAEKALSPAGFYKTVFNYLIILQEDVVLKDWLEEESDNYSLEHKRIWEENKATDEEVDIQDENTQHLEEFHIGASYSVLKQMIYENFSYYKQAKNKQERDPRIEKLFKNDPSSLYIRRINSYRKHFIRLHQAILSRPVNNTSPLSFDIETGDFEYSNVQGTLNPKTREYKVFNLLYSNMNKIMPYSDLVKVIYGDERITFDRKQALSEVISKLKKDFGILPKHPKSNKNIFLNQTNVGYRLTFIDSD